MVVRKSSILLQLNASNMNLDTVSMDISDFALKGRCIFNVDQYCDSWTCEKHQAFHTQ